MKFRKDSRTFTKILRNQKILNAKRSKKSTTTKTFPLKNKDFHTFIVKQMNN